MAIFGLKTHGCCDLELPRAQPRARPAGSLCRLRRAAPSRGQLREPPGWPCGLGPAARSHAPPSSCAPSGWPCSAARSTARARATRHCSTAPEVPALERGPLIPPSRHRASHPGSAGRAHSAGDRGPDNTLAWPGMAVDACQWQPVAGRAAQALPARLCDDAPGRDLRAHTAATACYAIGSSLRKGRLSQLLPAATMQLRPAGVVLTTVQVSLSSDA